MCGENLAGDRDTLYVEGSSPRVRGKRESEPRRFGANGLIPACAGKTRALRGPLLQPRAHPRVCGENEPGLDLADPASGSSPRVRGKRVKLYDSLAGVRLIPACAGKTP